MKVTIHMKTPDAVEYALEDVQPPEEEGLDEEEQMLKREETLAEVKALLKTWFSYGECITLEVDTEAKTCKVLPARG